MNKFNLRNRYKFNRNYIYIVVAFLFIIGIGFAYIQSTFSISGSADIKNGAWNIHFANVTNINNYDLIDINRKISDQQELIQYNNRLIKEKNERIVFLNSKIDTCIDEVPAPVEPEDPDIPIEDPEVPLLDDSAVIATSDEEIYYCWDIETEISYLQNYIYSLQDDINNYLKPELEQLIAEKNEMAPAIVISEDAKSISIPLLLESKLDFIEFEVDVVNEGKYDAMIADLASASIPNDLVNFLKIAVTYQNGNEIQNNDLLAAGETKVLKIKLSFKDDVGNEEVPIGEYKIDYGIPYIQATSDAVDRS